MPLLRKGQYLAACGYPTELNIPDYERFVLKDRAFTVSAIYAGPDTESQIEVAAVNVDHPISNFDGMSGAPVFAIIESAPVQILTHIANTKI